VTQQIFDLLRDQDHSVPLESYASHDARIASAMDHLQVTVGVLNNASQNSMRSLRNWFIENR